MPSTPSAPASIEPAWNDIVGVSINSFTGQQQFYNWGVGPCELSVTLPPMPQSEAGAWITFLQGLQGIANYFVFTSSFAAAYPDILMSGGGQRYWRLKSNQRRWTVGKDRLYRIAFDCREAL